MNSTAAPKIHSEIGMTADKNGRVRFHTLGFGRTFPLKRSIALASIEAGCNVYVGNFHDAICGRGHYATPAEIEEFIA